LSSPGGFNHSLLLVKVGGGVNEGEVGNDVGRTTRAARDLEWRLRDEVSVVEAVVLGRGSRVVVTDSGGAVIVGLALARVGEHGGKLGCW
jgi:hypothetical protein